MLRYVLPFALLTSCASVNYVPTERTCCNKRAYNLFNKDGQTTYDNLLEDAKKADLILFGEFHNNPISHWLQFELTKDLYVHSGDLMLGAEMFETDTQKTLDDYLDGRIEEKEFKKSARAWPNYDTDYAPLVNFAKEHGLPFIATNIPRRFAKLVNKECLEALDDLTDEEKGWIAPLPLEFDPEQYKELLDMEDHEGNIREAQAVKDATMAHIILKNRKGKFIHFNGDYHTEGIEWYLRGSDVKILTIRTTEQGDIEVLDEVGADYTICVDEDMTKTY